MLHILVFICIVLFPGKGDVKAYDASNLLLDNYELKVKSTVGRYCLVAR